VVAADVHGGLGLVLVLVHRHDHVHIDHPCAMAPDALQSLLGISSNGGCDFHMMAGEIQLHDDLLVHCHCGNAYTVLLRSFEGAMPIDSRYFATVRRATGIPSSERIPAMRLSESGAPGGSSRISLRILARMAVDDVPEPSAPSTWLEKK